MELLGRAVRLLRGGGHPLGGVVELALALAERLGLAGEVVEQLAGAVARGDERLDDEREVERRQPPVGHERGEQLVRTAVVAADERLEDDLVDAQLRGGEIGQRQVDLVVDDADLPDAADALVVEAAAGERADVLGHRLRQPLAGAVGLDDLREPRLGEDVGVEPVDGRGRQRAQVLGGQAAEVLLGDLAERGEPRAGGVLDLHDAWGRRRAAADRDPDGGTHR